MNSKLIKEYIEEILQEKFYWRGGEPPWKTLYKSFLKNLNIEEKNFDRNFYETAAEPLKEKANLLVSRYKFDNDSARYARNLATKMLSMHKSDIEIDGKLRELSLMMQQ